MSKTDQHHLSGRQAKWSRLLDELENSRLLDIGCSDGWLAELVLSRGCSKVVAIDSNKEKIHKIDKIKNVKYTYGDALKLKFKKNSFDVVSILDVIEHLPMNSESIALKNINRVLKKGGHVFISVPHHSFFSNILDPAWYFGHRHYRADAILNIIINSGFKIDWVYVDGGFYSIIYMILFYFLGIVIKDVKLRMNLLHFLDSSRIKEYSKNKGFLTIFIKARKI